MKSHLPCRKCGATERGARAKQGKTTGPCLPCKRTIGKLYYQNNKEKCLSKALQYKKENPNKIKGYEKKSHLKKRYNMTLDEYHFLCAEQDNKCAICFKDKELVVDHCHLTNKIRGLLCAGCNLALGGFKDNILALKSAIAYLEGAQKSDDIPTT